MSTPVTSGRAALRPQVENPPDVGLTPPWTTADRLVHIQALGQHVDRHIRFICGVASLEGTSQEAKDKAVSVFYERLVSMERQLKRIHEGLQLG